MTEYKGFRLEQKPDGRVTILAKDGEVLSIQLSLEKARLFIDSHLRRGGK